MSTYMDMTFTGTLSTDVDGLAPDTGGGAFTAATANNNATKLSGTGTAARLGPNAAGPHWWNQTVPTADYQVDHVINVKSIMTGDLGAVMARLVDESNYYRAYITAAGLLHLDKVVANTATDLAGSVSESIVASDTHTISVRVVGNQITALWDGAVVIGPITDSTFASAGKGGFRVGAQATVQTATTGIHADRLTIADPPAASPPVNTAAPVVTTDGTPATGETVTCSTGTWSNFPTFAYQWQRNTGAGFANIAGATTSSYLLAIADEGNGVRCVVTATNGAGSASANSNTITPAVSSPLAEGDITFRLGGGASNSNPGNSYGGVESSVEVATNLLDIVTFSEAIAGVPAEYRLAYVHNGHSTFGAGVKAWISVQLPAGMTLAIAWATEAAGSTVTTPADDKTAPVGVTFTSPADLASAIDSGLIPHGSFKGLWLRREVDALQSPRTSNPWEVSTQVSQL